MTKGERWSLCLYIIVCTIVTVSVALMLISMLNGMPEEEVIAGGLRSKVVVIVICFVVFFSILPFVGIEEEVGNRF